MIKLIFIISSEVIFPMSISRKSSSSQIIKGCWLFLGCLALALGTIGIFLPLLPTVPFYMLTLFCFAKGSARLHRWFLQSDLYKKHVADFMEKKSMPLKSKAAVMSTVTIMMAFACWMMQEAPWAQLVVAAVWVIHVLYFIFVIKTEA